METIKIKDVIEEIRKVEKTDVFAIAFAGDFVDFNGAGLHALADAYERLVGVVTDIYKKEGQVYLGEILTELGEEGDWAKLVGLEVEDT